jgi:hypothetical protein
MFNAVMDIAAALFFIFLFWLLLAAIANVIRIVILFIMGKSKYDSWL